MQKKLKKIKSVRLPDKTLSEIHEALKKDGEVKILRFAKIDIKICKSKTWFSGVVNKEITIKEFKKVSFTPFKDLKDFCNKL